MNRSKKKGTYRSVMEFERKFLPKSFEKRIAAKPADAQALGVNLAKESLEKIRKQLAE